jgi:hypothetical protein
MNTSSTAPLTTVIPEPSPATWRTVHGYIYVQMPSGVFHVVRPDGGTEERRTLPASAVALVPRALA